MGTRNTIESAPIVKYASRLRKYWSGNPREAARLTATILSGPPYVYPPEEAQWVERQRANVYGILPAPHSETLEEWLARAKDLYRERYRTMKRGTAAGDQPRNDKTARHCDWFVRVHLLGWRVDEADHAAVSRAVSKVARLLGISRHR